MLIIEGIHFKLDIKNGNGPNRYQIGKFGVPMYFVKVYQFVGVFLFGAATEQTITNILKFSVGKSIINFPLLVVCVGAPCVSLLIEYHHHCGHFLSYFR